MIQSTKKISMARMADRLGLSPMTVSRVLAGRGPVSGEAREKVLRLAESCGYKKKARRTSEKRVALLLADPGGDNYFSRLCPALARELPRKEGYSCGTFSLSEGELEDAARTSDIVVFCSPVGEAEAGRVKEANPAVGVVTMFSGKVGDISVNPDDHMGGALAALHLYGRGHRHVAVCTDTIQSNHLDRQKSFYGEFMSMGGGTRVDIVRFDSSANFEDSCSTAVEKYWRGSRGKPDSFFCVNYKIAGFTLNTLSRLGVVVPKETGILGYDEADVYGMLPVRMSRIVFDPADLVRLTAACVRKGLLDGPLSMKGAGVLLGVSLKDCGSVPQK